MKPFDPQLTTYRVIVSAHDRFVDVVVDSRTGYVVRSEALLAWAKGKRLAALRRHCSRKGWRMSVADARTV